jgi:putative transposase
MVNTFSSDRPFSAGVPRKTTSRIGERVRLMHALLGKQKSIKRCCQQVEVSRTTAWKWRRRFWREGRRRFAAVGRDQQQVVHPGSTKPVRRASARSTRGCTICFDSGEHGALRMVGLPPRMWATKERRPLIKPELQQRLWPHLGGIAREYKMKALVVGGVEDHVHVRLSVPSTLSVAEFVPLRNDNSSKWIHNTFKEHWGFEWQEGYGAFSIGISGVADTAKYIQGQAEHHRKMTFKQALEVFLKKHGIEFAEQDLE